MLGQVRQVGHYLQCGQFSAKDIDVITLTVVSYNGQPSDSRLSAQFDELGGTIGRADSNQLVLPDPDRAISRVHAQVVFRNGTFAVADRGSNPILVNGQAVGSGREQKIAEGDRMQIGRLTPLPICWVPQPRRMRGHPDKVPP